MFVFQLLASRLLRFPLSPESRMPNPGCSASFQGGHIVAARTVLLRVLASEAGRQILLFQVVGWHTCLFFLVSELLLCYHYRPKNCVYFFPRVTERPSVAYVGELAAEREYTPATAHVHMKGVARSCIRGNLTYTCVCVCI